MYPRSGGTGESTPFAEQSKEKEQDKGHDSNTIYTSIRVVFPKLF